MNIGIWPSALAAAVYLLALPTAFGEANQGTPLSDYEWFAGPLAAGGEALVLERQNDTWRVVYWISLWIA